jgi:hypothetical protein
MTKNSQYRRPGRHLLPDELVGFRKILARVLHEHGTDKS